MAYGQSDKEISNLEAGIEKIVKENNTEIKDLIKEIGLSNTKAKNLKGMAEMLLPPLLGAPTRAPNRSHVTRVRDTRAS